jgi:PPOX class probable F420-dependent enzyme
LRRNAKIELAPSTFRGKATGDAVRGSARLLAGDEAKRASRLIARRHRLLQGVIVPVLHRVQGRTTVHFEVVFD